MWWWWVSTDYIIISSNSINIHKICYKRWKTDDVESTETTDDLLALITNLKPFTQYAYYVKTYTVASESIGAQSDIEYFTTLPGSKLIIMIFTI